MDPYDKTAAAYYVYLRRLHRLNIDPSFEENTDMTATMRHRRKRELRALLLSEYARCFDEAFEGQHEERVAHCVETAALLTEDYHLGHELVLLEEELYQLSKLPDRWTTQRETDAYYIVGGKRSLREHK